MCIGCGNTKVCLFHVFAKFIGFVEKFGVSEYFNNCGCGTSRGAGVCCKAVPANNLTMSIILCVLLVSFCSRSVYLRLTLMDGYSFTFGGVKLGGIFSKIRSICRFSSINDRVSALLGFFCWWFFVKSFKDDF